MQKKNDNMDQILNSASKKFGVSSDDIKKGSVDKLLKNVKAEDAKKIQSVLNNPKAAEELLATPQAQQLLKQLLGEK